MKNNMLLILFLVTGFSALAVDAHDASSSETTIFNECSRDSTIGACNYWQVACGCATDYTSTVTCVCS